MSKQDLIKLAVGLLISALVLLIACMFPQYRVLSEDRSQGFKVVRRPIWDPPLLVEGGPVTVKTQGLQDDLVMPSGELVNNAHPLGSLKASPMIFNIRVRGRERNWLSLLAAGGLAFYIAFVVRTWIHRG